MKNCTNNYASPHLLLTIVLLCLLLPVKSFAVGENCEFYRCQENAFLPASPLYTKFMEVTSPKPALLTGAIQFSVPLYTVECDGYTLPFSLEYKSNETYSYVDGTSLTSSVTRTVKSETEASNFMPSSVSTFLQYAYPASLSQNPVPAAYGVNLASPQTPSNVLNAMNDRNMIGAPLRKVTICQGATTLEENEYALFDNIVGVQTPRVARQWAKRGSSSPWLECELDYDGAMGVLLYLKWINI